MAEMTETGPMAGASPVRHLAKYTNYAGAAVSLALLVGIGVWGTKLVLRDVSGVPVVAATEGPMRVAPENPGGQAADHQGLSVNAVAGSGIAGKPADTLRLAPQSEGLSEEDVALASLREESEPDGAAGPLPAVSTADLPSLAELVDTETDPRAALQALADRLAGDAQPLSATAPQAAGPDELTPVEAEVSTALGRVPDGAAEEAALVEVAAIPTKVPGVATSLRPSVRPQGLRGRVVAAAAVADQEPEGPREIAAADLPDGTRLVQLGAYDSPETARGEWGRLAGRFGDYLEGKDRVIQKASSGGKTFYRLRAHGFDDLSDARRFCAAFVAENADCIPVVTR